VSLSERTYDAKLTDLLSTPRKLAETPLVADSDQPVLLESLGSHSDAVIDHNDRRVLFVQVCREKNLDGARPGIERVCDQLLDRFVRARVQTLGEEFDNPVAETDVDLVRLLSDCYESRFVRHVLRLSCCLARLGRAAFDAFRAIVRCFFFVNAFALAVSPLLPMLARNLGPQGRIAPCQVFKTRDGKQQLPE
jgi:hypothetical protein